MIVKLCLLPLLMLGCQPHSVDAGDDMEQAPSDMLPAPKCSVAMTGPVRVFGDESNGSVLSCSEWKSGSILSVLFRFGQRHVDVQTVTVEVDTRVVEPGSTVALGAGVSLSDDHCSTLAGRGTFTSDEPNWSVSVNAQCEEKPERWVIATWSGSQPINTK